MGAQHSLPGQDANAPAARVCYYVLLDVNQDATELDIKKAYRKKALELHPDRNINDVQMATRNFAEVQAAYDVLSDPQERAWYDSHRDAILSGQDDPGHGAEPATFRNVRLTTTDEILSLVRKFSATVPFNDQPSGFFGIAREVFEHLALEEDAAAEAIDSDCSHYPTFGFADDDYDSVVKPFYVSWAGFSTKKSFSWKDKYRTSDAPDRRTRRFIEKENKKCRDDALREFNEAVGFLVGFVRKRDPRYLQNVQTDAERQKSLRDVVAAQAARSRAANREKMASCSVPNWTRLAVDDTQNHFFSESEDESEVEVLECVVCSKLFKSVNQLEAHERSKKHIKAVQELRRQMQKEGVELDLDTGHLPTPDLDRSSPVVSPELPTVPRVVEPGGSGVAKADTTLEGHASSSPKGSISPLSNDEYASRSKVEQRFASGRACGGRTADSSSEAELSARMQDTTVDKHSGPRPKIGKAKAKRERRKAAAESSADGGVAHQCSACLESFESRTKLFRHIRKEGHAAAISGTGRRDDKAVNKKR